MKYRFGTVCVDADARTIANAAGTAHLRRKGFDLLLLLLECHPRAVSKEQIYGRLWPDTFVSESSLQSLVHEIRQAIDDRATRRCWITAVHGVGYRFEGEVTRDEPRPPEGRTATAGWLLGDSIRLALRWGENIIGRAVQDEVGIEAPSMSRRHARIVIGQSTTIEDLGSKNGTWLQGERLTSARSLSDGDVLRFGSVTLIFRRTHPAESTE